MAAREEGGLPARCISLLEEVKGLLEGQDNNARNMNESGVRLVNDAGAVTSDVAIFSPLLFNLYINDLPYAFQNTLSDPIILPNGTIGVLLSSIGWIWFDSYQFLRCMRSLNIGSVLTYRNILLHRFAVICVRVLHARRSQMPF